MSMKRERAMVYTYLDETVSVLRWPKWIADLLDRPWRFSSALLSRDYAYRLLDLSISSV